LLHQPPGTLYLLGSDLCTSGRLEQGIAVLRKAQWRYPDDFWISLMLGYRVVELGPAHRDESLGFLRAAAALRPQSAGAWQHLGSTLDADGKPDEAIECLERAVELNPKYAGAHVALGSALRNQNRLDEAIACFTKAIELDPKSFLAHVNLGHVLKRQDRVDEAISFYWNAVELNPRDAAAVDRLFNAIRAQETREKTISFFAKVTEASPENARAHWYLGCALWYQGNIAESLGPFRKSSELAPNESRHLHSLANTLSALNKVDEAIVAYRRAAELNLKSSDIRYRLGVALNRNGQLEEALACWKKAVEMDAACVQGHTALAWHLATAPDSTLRDPQAAVAYAQTAVDLAPTANHLSNLGVALLRASDTKTAIEKLEQADRMSKDGDHFHRFFLAMAYWQIGEKDKARQTYEQGVQWMDTNQPENEELRRFRAEAEELMTKESGSRNQVSERKSSPN
jgi:superkiller protein 3